jgi:hypothetical protein
LIKTISRSQTFERKYVSDRLDRLRDQETEFTQLRTRGGLRIAPFSVCLFGQSGCGKSSLTNLTINAGLRYNGLSAAKDRIATWADNDKFASAIRSHINAIIFDDFANTKEDFMDFSPAYRLIQVINNVRYLAPMADVFLKGKVSLNPFFCLISTNVEHLNAAKYSNEPESVLRRMYHVKVIPKPECCKNGVLNKEKVEAIYGKTPCPDAWFLTVRVYDAINCRHVKMDAFKPVTFRGKKMVNISVREYLKWVQLASKKHFDDERAYIDNQETEPTECPGCGAYYCDSCKIPQATAAAAAKKVAATRTNDEPTQYKHFCKILEPHSGIVDHGLGKTYQYWEEKSKVIKEYYNCAKSGTILAAHDICIKWNRIDFMPERFICHPNVLKLCLFFWREDIKQSLIAGLALIVFLLVTMCFYLPRFSIFWLLCAGLLAYWYVCATVQTYHYMIRDRILELKDVVKTYTQSWQFKYAIVGLGAIALVTTTMRSRYKKLEAQTGLNPSSIDDINERNDSTNPWLVAETVPLPMSEPSKTTTSDDLARSMKTNLVGVVSDSGKTTLGFYVVSNFLLVPTHFLKAHGDRDIDIRCYKNGMDKVGSFFRDKIAKTFSVAIPATDFTLCFVTGGGSMKDFRKFFPTGNNLGKCPAKLVTREIMDTSLTAVPTLFKGIGRVAHSQSTFSGSYYDLPIDTKNGMCMSPLISDSRGSMILGFHLGGKGRLGGCGTLTLDQVNLALSELSTVDGVVLSASCGELLPHMGDFPKSSFGKPTFDEPSIHPKSAVNYLTSGACIDVYGKTFGKATPYSSVSATIISPIIEEVFGVPQKWGPPKMRGKGRYPYQATLVHAAVPSLPIGSVLNCAVRSIKDLTCDLKEKIPELFAVGPLCRVATVSGLAGVKFIDAMNFSSSPGFPLTGSKKPLLIDLKPEDYPEVGKPRTFIREVWDEFEDAVEKLREGKRCYMIWKSCLKDEPTKESKDKVRVFQSAPLVLQLLVRMYFLPIVRIIQMNPILYECAVGVNAEGMEWEELWEAAMSKGKSRVLAGDYSKYDVRMPAQVTIAAFDILIDIAAQCSGYSSDDLHIMRMMVNEIVYPVMAYNGDLIQLFGTNPSGQNLTVIINSLVNSLLLRSCFFSLYPEKNFKQECSFLTYGDDVIGSVSENCCKFTHINYAKWLAKHDMKFTMPDKESVATHYMREEDVDFLKRTCVFNPDLGQKVGLLSEDSIFKRLHSHLLSKELTLEMHSAQNIDTSLHDWFFYGRETFEDRRDKLRLVAEKCGISHLCPGLDLSYDQRVKKWRQKYLGEEIEDEDITVLEEQCGDMFVGTYDYMDHCRGTGADIYYGWEHWVADFSLPFYLLLAYMYHCGYSVHFGRVPWYVPVLMALLTPAGMGINFIWWIIWTRIEMFVFYKVVFSYVAYVYNDYNKRNKNFVPFELRGFS